MIDLIVQGFLENPESLIALGVLGVLCFLVAIVRLVRSARLRFGRWVQEIPLIKHIGQWFQENPWTFPLAIGVPCLLLSIALLVNPVRLVMHGKIADGVVTDVVKRTEWRDDVKGKSNWYVISTATILFKAGDRNIVIHRSKSRERGSTCIAWCDSYSKGQRLKILYLADDPEIAADQSFLDLFGRPLFLGLFGAMWLFVGRAMHSERNMPGVSL